MADDPLRKRAETALSVASRPSPQPADVEKSIEHLRDLVLLEGLPSESADERENLIQGKPGCSLRGRVWKALLRVGRLHSEHYLELLERGPCSKAFYDLIQDTFRTFATDPELKLRAPEAKLRRVLNSCAWTFDEAGLGFSYKQGMNAFAAVFLYTMPELDAFYALSKFIQQSCPTYFAGNYIGAFAGCKLVDEVLQSLDPVLHSHLQAKVGSPNVYAFKSILTFCSGTPPLSELLRLWDFFFAFGFHLSIVSLVAQCMLARDDLLASSNPLSLITKFTLDASILISMSVELLREIPEDLYERLVKHTVDLKLAKELALEGSPTFPKAASSSSSSQAGPGRPSA